MRLDDATHEDKMKIKYFQETDTLYIEFEVANARRRVLKTRRTNENAHGKCACVMMA